MAQHPPLRRGEKCSRKDLTKCHSRTRVGNAYWRAAKAGEPWRTFFLPTDLEARLHAVGFSQVTFLSPAASQEQYYAGRPDDLPAPRISTIVAAVR